MIIMMMKAMIMMMTKMMVMMMKLMMNQIQTQIQILKILYYLYIVLIIENGRKTSF
jgi:hypothetical protein